jgi:hypothetical protein
MATSWSQISAFDPLISRLAGPLLPADRAAFRAAAESALVGCDGEGRAYRIVAPLWRTFFRPPPDPRIGQPRRLESRPSKLVSLEPIGADDPRVGSRERRQFGAV